MLRGRQHGFRQPGYPLPDPAGRQILRRTPIRQPAAPKSLVSRGSSG